MEKFLKYNTKALTIEQTKWNKKFTAKTESIMAIGNGYLGLRSVDEEIAIFNKENLFVNGIFNKENESEVPELANLADLIQNQIAIDGEIFMLQKQDKYSKKINIKTGLLTRTLVVTRNKKQFKIRFERFVSQHNVHVYAQKIKIQQLSGQKANITLYPQINGQTTNQGAQHFKEGTKKRPTPNSVQYIEETTFSKRLVAHNMVVQTKLNNHPIATSTDNHVVTMNRRQVGFKIQIVIQANDDLELIKLMSVNTTIDNHQSLVDSTHVITKAQELHAFLCQTTYNQLWTKSIQKYQDVWATFSLKIIGNSQDAQYDALANAFSIFHMNAFVPKNNSNLSVGAKGLSGEGYQGHSFWDTEIFILPNFLFTNPSIARNLLEYRYKGLQGARAKANEKKKRRQESNLKGAQFPWEGAWPSDGEVCPYWGQVDIISGNQVPIASRRQEIHVAADIAYAVHQYYDFTHDDDFMINMGYEIMFDTAIFWSQRAEKQSNGVYMIKDVMGPNEYKGNIDNNAFTNAMAKHNLELALIYKKRLESTPNGRAILAQVISKIPYQFSFSAIADVAKNLVLQQPNKNGIIPENDQFLQLKRIDVAPFQLQNDAGKKLFSTKEGHKRLASQLVKQADVVLLTYLLPWLFTKDVICKNFDFYEPVTTHDSSLSPTTYAIQAIDLQKMELAYKLYKYSIDIDMGSNMHSSDGGIHAGALAAIWQTTIFGYGGLRWVNGKLHFNPHLPDQWDGLEYKIIYQSVHIQVKINTQIQIQTLNGKTLQVYIYDQEIIIGPQPIVMEVQND